MSESTSNCAKHDPHIRQVSPTQRSQQDYLGQVNSASSLSRAFGGLQCVLTRRAGSTSKVNSMRAGLTSTTSLGRGWERHHCSKDRCVGGFQQGKSCRGNLGTRE